MNMHEYIAESLPAFALGDLPEPQAAEIQAHLADCSDCRAALDRLRSLLAHTSRLQTLAVDSATAAAASQKLLASLQSGQSSRPGPRVLHFHSNLWTRLKESRIMQTKPMRISAAAAAVIAVTVGLYFLLGPIPGASVAWALDDTIQALKAVSVVHMVGSASDSSDGLHPAELWAVPDEKRLNTGDLRFVMAKPGGNRVVVVKGNTSYDYWPDLKQVRVMQCRMMCWPWPSGLVERFGDLKSNTITYGKDPETGRDSAFATGSHEQYDQAWSWWVECDLQSKLPVRVKVWSNGLREGLPMFDFSRMTFDEPLPPGVFDFQMPEGVKVVKDVDLDTMNRARDPKDGISVDGLTRDDACRRIVTQYWEALIDTNWTLASKLYPLASAEQLQSQFAANPPAKILQLGKPLTRNGCGIGPIVPCKIRHQDKSLQVPNLIVHFRKIDGRDSCVIFGLWNESLLDLDPSHGTSTAGLSRDEACRQLVTQHIQALIAADYDRASKLRPAIPAEQYALWYETDPIVELLEVGQPFQQSGCSIGPLVPCKTRLKDGTISNSKMIVHFRQIDGQESCVIEGTWGK